MVNFTCNHCGESLQKPKVEKHYTSTPCAKNTIAVSCMDCFKDFRLKEYVAHTKCITEDERYAAKGTVIGAKKGEAKQESWVAMVATIIQQQKNAKPGIKSLLEKISNATNIPRKQAKFINFVKSSFGGRVNMQDVNDVWDLIDAHTKASKAQAAPSPKAPKKRTADESSSNENADVEVVPKKKSKAEKKNKKINAEPPGTDAKEAKVNGDSPKKKNKKIKPEPPGTGETETKVNGDSSPKKKNKNKEVKTQPAAGSEEETEEKVNGDSPKKKRSKKNKVVAIKIRDKLVKKPKKEKKTPNPDEFSWRETILTILAEKPTGLHKDLLRKTVFKRYELKKGPIDHEERLRKLYNKKFKKIKLVSLTDGIVALKS